MVDAIEFWFDFSSPYAYFAAIEIDERLGRFGRPIRWRPLLLGVAFQKTGMGPLSQMPLRGNYAQHDWVRIAGMLNVPFILRDDHPMPSQSLARAYYWFLERHAEQAVPFARAAFDVYFGQGKDLRAAEDVVSLARGFTEEHDTLSHWLAGTEAKVVLRERTGEALAKGIFGSPFFLIDGEPFWGWDRLRMAEAWLRNPTWQGNQITGCSVPRSRTSVQRHV